MRKRTRKKGFTLVELLVVISIIALLLSILMPSLAAVREQAKAVVCSSNMKSLMLILQLYSEDNAGKTALHINRKNPLGRLFWTDLLHHGRYVQNDEVFMCPTNGKPKPAPGAPVNWYYPGPKEEDNMYGRVEAGIAANRYLVGFWESTTYKAEPYKSGKFMNYRKAVLGDAGYYYTLTNYTSGRMSPSESRAGWEFIVGPYSLGIPEKYFSLRHKGKLNAAISDGHIEKFDLKQLQNSNYFNIYPGSPELNR